MLPTMEHMPRNPKAEVDPLRSIKQSTHNPPTPPIVRGNVRRHHETLARLAQKIRNLDIDNERIEERVIELFEDYERELAAYLGRLKAAHQSRRLNRAAR